MAFPIFFFDSNLAFGEVNSPEDLERVLAVLTKDQFHGNRAEAIEFMRRAKNAQHPEVREIDPLMAALEKWKKIPNFGYRREHIGGLTTLGEWLWAHKALHLLTGDPEPGTEVH